LMIKAVSIPQCWKHCRIFVVRLHWDFNLATLKPDSIGSK
jgi:hypothetical protein